VVLKNEFSRLTTESKLAFTTVNEDIDERANAEKTIFKTPVKSEAKFYKL